MSEAMTANVQLKYNGVDATVNLSNSMQSFSITENATGSADSINLELSNRNGKWSKGYYPVYGDWIKAWIKVENWKVGKKNEKLYLGKYTIDNIAFSNNPRTVSLSGISIPVKSGFNATQRNKTWKKTNVKTILSDIAKNAGVKFVYDAPNHKIDEESQSGQTDMSFAFSLCSEYGMCMKLFDNKLVVYEQTKYEKADPAFVVSRNDVESYSFDVSTLTDYDCVRIQYTKGEKSDKTINYNFKRPGKKGERRLFVSTKCESVGQAETKAKAALREELRKNKTVSFTMMGDIRFQAALNMKLEGFGRLNGKYFIDSVTHNIGNSFKTEVRAHAVVTDF